MLAKISAWILILVFGLVVLHAPMIVFIGTHFPDFDILVKGWKEALIFVAGTLLLIDLVRKGKLKDVLGATLSILIAIYLAILIVSTLIFQNGLHAEVAGLLIDARYLVFFVLVFAVCYLSPAYKKLFIRFGLIGALLVVVFAILQIFFLPKDFLTILGYSQSTILPYMTVDENHDFIRINSTLRGPNPLGAYMLIAISVLLAYLGVAHKKLSLNKKSLIVLAWVLALITIWSTYSRGALAGLLVVALVIFAIVYSKLFSKKFILVSGAIVVLLVGALVAFRDNEFVSNVFFHENSASISPETSNQGHVDSLLDGTERMLNQPLGAGVGSTGSPSYYATDSGVLIIENQYLNIAHESGWLGLVIYASIISLVLADLYRKRQDWLALGVFASGIGLTVIGFVLPVWVDDTVSLVWWGLAGAVLGASYVPSEKLLMRRFMDFNRKLSKGFDKLFLPASWRVDGLGEYINVTLPPLAKRAASIYDIGGGSRPYVGTIIARNKRNKYIVGVDISRAELNRAPKGVYDDKIVADVGARKIKLLNKKASLVICQMVFEHVEDVEQALMNVSHMMNSNGTLAIFVPSRNALFAKLNLLFTESFKKRLLAKVFPDSHSQGFKAYYDKCTPREMIEAIEDAGLSPKVIQHYFEGHYFSFFLPFHIFWRLYQIVSYIFIRENASDYFCIIAKKEN